MIENTTTDASKLSFMMQVLATGQTSRLIEAQEKIGQQQLVASDRLPADLRNDRAAFEAVGFVFGDPDPADPLFMPVTLPDGWSKQASSHEMWSYVVDQLGRRRVRVFYKAAFYDRRAHAGLSSVYSYVEDCLYARAAVVTDETWATPQAVLDAVDDLLIRNARDIERYRPGSPSANEQDLKNAHDERRHLQSIAGAMGRTT